MCFPKPHRSNDRNAALFCVFFFFSEGIWHGLQPEGADRGERLQHVRVGHVEEQEAADVCGSERPREATEREENPQEEQGHPLPSNCGVSWRTQFEKEDTQHWTNTGRKKKL